MAFNVNTAFTFPGASRHVVYTPLGGEAAVKKRKKQKKKQPQNTNAFVLLYPVSCSKPCQRKMQQQRALEALPCIALTPTYIHTLHTENACSIFSVHLMHRKLTKHFRHKLQLYDIHHFVQLLDAGSFSYLKMNEAEECFACSLFVWKSRW